MRSYLLLLILFAIQVDAAILLEKSSYALNEQVKISIQDALPDSELAISSPTNVYRYLGIPSILVFRPQEEGLHRVELISGDQLVDSVEFYAGEKVMLQIDKRRYKIGETAIISFQAPPNYTLQVTGESKNYFFNNVNSPVSINLTEPGKYQAKLGSIAEQFEVKGRYALIDSSNRSQSSKIRLYSKGTLVREGSLEKMEVSGTYDAEIEPGINNVKRVHFKGLKFGNDFSMGIEDKVIPGFEKSYAIDPTNLSFDSAIVTSVAQGESLFKCKDWNFTEGRCFGTWEKIMDLVPGQEYSFVLTQDDPGYGEQGSLPTPHPVSGYVFYNATARADNGIKVSILDRAIMTYALTQVYAPPIPSLKGAYSADIYGFTSDSIAVRAWNQTMFGETNSTLSGQTTYVNVTMNITRGSETNVTIISPLNNTVFNIGQPFNVTANVGAIISSGTSCSVSVTTNIGTLAPGQNQTQYLGSIPAGTSLNFTWNLTAIGSTGNVTVNASCASEVLVLEMLDRASVY
ncbi:MAG: hypothetical protein HGA85_03840, partial [Nanoarchaeota archaeon]|nr:hypothetical protein [Nanoarchaeota archaeon]